MAIFYTQYEAIPLPESEEFEEVGGAYISCWLRAASEEEASERASATVSRCGWRILFVEEACFEVAEEIYSEDEECLGFFRKALAEGECYVFHQWPIEPQAGDDVH